MYDEIDLEDIECRLYSQVYHVTTENEENNLPSDSNITLDGTDKIGNGRYFTRKEISSPPLFIPLEDTATSKENCSTVNNNTSTEGLFGTRFHDFIFNQCALRYTEFEVLNSNYTSEKLYVPWSIQNDNLLNRRNRRKRVNNRKRKSKKKNKNCQNSEYARQEINVQQKHVVFISDDSDGECLIVNDMCEKTVKSKEKPKSPNIVQNAESESDDDIIYIPPPPVEVINVDPDNEEENATENAPEITEIAPESSTVENASDSAHIQSSNTTNSKNASEVANTSEISASNDFLDNAGIESNTSRFNFGLHGSDFNNTADFARPANPADYCETESSCSTNDFNRELNNSVKTIVFKEVDFPKEDIFSEKNLESFSTYITPKRRTFRAATHVSEDESSSSSSESDYEHSNITNKNTDVESKKLPTLSPMQCEKAATPNRKLKKKNATVKPDNKQRVTKSNKRRSGTIDREELGNNSDEETKTRKPKKKKTSNKKSNAPKESDKAIDAELQNKESESNTGVSSEETAGANTNVSSEKEVNNASEKICNNESHSEENENTQVCLEQSNEQTSRKKRKKNSSKFKKNETDNAASNLGETTSEKGKRKKKKSSSETIADDDGLGEEFSDTNKTVESGSNTKDCTLEDNTNSAVPTRKSSTESKKDENQVVSTEEISNKRAPSEPQSIEKCTNETLPHTLGTSAVTLGEIGSDQEVIIVDDTISCDEGDHLEIMVSSDSEYDFKDLESVGQDLELLNCTTRKEPVHVTKQNVCYDYSKFNVEQIQNTQSDNPDDWKVSPKDRLTFLNTKERGPRCNRCRHFGHVAIRCTEKPDPPSCTLCGFSDHQEPRCPHKRCTQCGNEGDYSTTYCWKCFKFRNVTCRLCKMTGHIAKTCPDLWRRYHLTIDAGPIVVSQEPQLKPRDQLWCSGCAGQGHLEHECNYYNREYPPTNPSILSYEDVLEREARRPVTPPPPPPPVWNSPERSNPDNNIVSLPSTSQNIPYNTQIFIPPLMTQIVNLSQIIPLLTQNQIVEPNTPIPCNSSAPPASTKVLNPYSALVSRGKKGTGNYRVLDQMMSDYVNDGVDLNLEGSYESEKGRVIHPHMVKHGVSQLLDIHQRRVKQIIMNMPMNAVKQFIKKELSDLENVVTKCDPKYLKQKLFKYDTLPQSKKVLSCALVKEKCFWYRILNMFIIGVHHYKGGRVHVNYIKRFLSESKRNKLDNNKRKPLYNAYNYVFNGNRHPDVNYYRALEQIKNKISAGN